MAVDLDAALLAAQTAQSRKPRIALSAGKAVPDIPFTGSPLANPQEVAQSTSFSIFLPGGEFVVFYTGGSYLRMMKTDDEVLAFGPYQNIAKTSALFIDGVLIPVGVGLAVIRSTTNLTFYRVREAGTVAGSTSISLTAVANGCAVCTTDTGYACITTRVTEEVSYIELRTSTDFTAWSSASVITIPSFDTSYPVRDPSIIQLDDGSYLLLMSVATMSEGDSDVYNVVYSLSNDLSTWTAFEALTASTTASTNYYKPDVVQKENGSLFISIQKNTSYLLITKNTDGWNSSANMYPLPVWVDEASGKVYFHGMWFEIASKYYAGSAQIDIDSWAIEKFYSKSTTPAVPAAVTHVQDGTRHYGQGSLGVWGDNLTVCVIDFENDDIRAFYGKDLSSTYGPEAAKNISFSGDGVVHTQIDGNRLWVGLKRYSFGQFNDKPTIGYIDLDQITPPYEFITKCNFGDPSGLTVGNFRFSVYPEDELCVVSHAQSGGVLGAGAILLGDMATDSLLKDYRRSTYPEMPYGGGFDSALVDNTLFVAVNYTTVYAGDSHKWGLAEINLLTDQVQYHYPPWLTSPGNYFHAITLNGDRNELILNINGGAATYNYVTGSWSRWTSATFPGMPNFSKDLAYWPIMYDNSRDIFLSPSRSGLYLIPRSGTANIMEYFTSAHNGAEWIISDKSQLVTGYRNDLPAISLSTDNEVYATWTNLAGSYNRVLWDKEEGSIDLLSYLVGETQFRYQIDGPSELTFSLSHGHLFDPSNTYSLLAPYVKKGRLVTCQLGEEIEGVSSLTDHGRFLVSEVQISYERDVYPIIKVTASDKTTLWDMHKVMTAVVDNKTPEAALVELITAHSDFTAGDISVPSLTGSFSFDASWIDQFLIDIISDVAHRFEHFPVIKHDGTVTFRPITVTGDSDRTVSLAEVIEFTPDDRYSDFTNRITVTGLSLYEFSTLYSEERVGTLSGTVGWYGFDKDFYVYYSDDESKRVKNPRLKVLETSTSIMFQLAGQIKERIGHVDPFDKYCIVEVKAPDLRPYLAACISSYLAGNAVGDIAPTIGGMTIPVGRVLERIGIYGAFLTLASIGNFKYEVWGQPVGFLRRQYSASADDVELQNEIGMVVENKFDGFLCHNGSHCEAVADFELMIAKGQRNRVTVRKTAHLQDEIGDTLTIPHPITEIPVKVFVTNLTRKYLPSDGQTQGYFLDEIEGWIC